MELAGTSVLLTGASTGIGAATAVALASRGARLALVARRGELLAEVAASCVAAGGVPPLVLPTDLADLEAAAAVTSRAESELGGVDVLINNAGAAKRKHLSRLTFDDVTATMNLNYLSPVKMMMTLLPHQIARGRGVIVNVGSLAARVGAPIETAYAASKFALTGFSESAFCDLAGTGVRVAVVQPGTIDTPLWEPAPGDDKPIYTGDLLPASTVADAILAAIEGETFEAFVPADLQPLMVFKAQETDLFLQGAIAFAAGLRGDDSTTMGKA